MDEKPNDAISVKKPHTATNGFGYVILFLFIAPFIGLKVAWEGATKCEEMYSKVNSGIFSEGKSQKIWARVRDGTYVSGFVIQPNDYQVPATTVLCRFKKDSFIFDGFEIYSGNIKDSFFDQSHNFISPFRYF